MGDPLDDARRLLADGTWVALRPVRGDGDPWRIRYTSGPLVRYALRALADEAERQMARIADLEADLAKPVATAWIGHEDDRNYRVRQGLTRAGAGLACEITGAGWVVYAADEKPYHTVAARGPETGPEAERLADAAAAPHWRLT